MDAAGDVTGLLIDWGRGSREALEKLTPVVYQELRAMAQNYMGRERPDHTLQATALVHEVYLRLVDQRKVNWKNRAHFFGVASKLMRRILVDHARERRAARRGGESPKTVLEDVSVFVLPDQEMMALDQALTALEDIDARKSQVVELKFFGGMTTEEAADFLAVSPATVERDWSMARAWLYREMQAAAPPG